MLPDRHVDARALRLRLCYAYPTPTVQVSFNLFLLFICFVPSHDIMNSTY